MIKENKFYSMLIDEDTWDTLKDYLEDYCEIFPININYQIFLPLNNYNMEELSSFLDDNEKILKIIESDFWKEAKKFLEENENCELFIGIN